MDAATAPTFEHLDKFPREIRDIIFGYMIQNTIESHVRPRDFGLPLLWRNEFHSHGLEPFYATSHLNNSPWVTLNKQYCAEYLRIFAREVELRVRFTCKWTKHHAVASATTGLNAPKDILRLITRRLNIADPSAGIESSNKILLSRIKGICFSYHYHGSFFDRGFGKTERHRSPPNDFLDKPMQILRQYHDDLDIPSNRLSISISYGEPGWTVVACLGEIDRGVSHDVISLYPVQARIHVDDHDASVAALDRELEVLRVAMDKILEKMRIRFPRGEGEIVELEDYTNRDLGLLRRAHLKAIDRVTKFWKAQDDESKANYTSGVAKH